METKRQRRVRPVESLCSAQVQVDDQSTLPSSYRSFVASGGYDEPYAPARGGDMSKLYTEGDTHA